MNTYLEIERLAIHTLSFSETVSPYFLPGYRYGISTNEGKTYAVASS